MPPRDYLPLCTIAGSDPTGGAGLQGDLKTFCAHGGVGTAVVTALTVQDRKAVYRVEPVAPDLVTEQLEVVLREVKPRGIKTGMLWSGPLIEAVAELLQPIRQRPIVVDPVLVATSGGALLRPDALEAMRDLLIPRATVITPNLPEAARLLGREGIEEAEMEAAAQGLLELGASAVLLKGGHGRGDEAVDWLATRQETHKLVLPRIPDADAHGTGCALAAALTARLARGDDLLAAARGAKDWVHRAMRSAEGRGPGAPLDHTVS